MNRGIKVADECWVALALLTREHSERSSFSSGEILARIRQEHIHPAWRPGIQAHIHQHNVANRPPSTALYRMMYRLDDGTYRLYRPGDDYHTDRSGKTHPVRSELPAAYHALLDWYEDVYCRGQKPVQAEKDPILSLRGLGKEIWRDVDADAWVDELRSGWGDVVPVAEPRAHRGSTQRAASSEGDRIWERILRHQHSEFKTRTNLPFTYEVEGGSGIWFFRDGRRIEHRLWRGEVEAALNVSPLRKPSDLSRFQCPSYLFGLLTDPRIASAEEAG